VESIGSLTPHLSTILRMRVRHCLDRFVSKLALALHCSTQCEAPHWSDSPPGAVSMRPEDIVVFRERAVVVRLDITG